MISIPVFLCILSILIILSSILLLTSSTTSEHFKQNMDLYANDYIISRSNIQPISDSDANQLVQRYDLERQQIQQYKIDQLKLWNSFNNEHKKEDIFEDDGVPLTTLNPYQPRVLGVPIVNSKQIAINAALNSGMLTKDLVPPPSNNEDIYDGDVDYINDSLEMQNNLKDLRNHVAAAKANVSVNPDKIYDLWIERTVINKLNQPGLKK